MEKLNKKQIDDIKKLRAHFPRTLEVKTERSLDGGFFAEITTIPGCFTEADNFSELIGMVNDAVKTYLEIPVKYAPFMPNYIPPLAEAKRLDIFPPTRKGDNIKLTLDCEAKAC